MKKVVAAACALLFIAAMGFAQAAPAKVLDQKTLDKFLADYPKIAADGEKLGIDVEDTAAQGGGETATMAPPAPGELSKMMRKAMDGLKQNPEARKLIGKYGWNDRFWDILFVIGASIGAVSMEESFEGQPVPQQMKPYVDDLKGAVHPSDYDLVKKDRARIEETLASGDE